MLTRHTFIFVNSVTILATTEYFSLHMSHLVHVSLVVFKYFGPLAVCEK